MGLSSKTVAILLSDASSAGVRRDADRLRRNPDSDVIKIQKNPDLDFSRFQTSRLKNVQNPD
jgi:hypothetical protein